MILNRVMSAILPNRCAVCAAPATGGLALCQACRNALPRITLACRVCADQLTGTSETDNSLICGHCQQQPPYFDASLAPLQYKTPMNQLITGLKFNARLAHSRLLAALFMPHINQENSPDLLIPMPLHKKRLRERGFNQSLEIARELSKLTMIPVDSQSCTRIRYTEPQSSLSKKEKKKNVRGAFAVNGNMGIEHVAIVDDVMTSGHTANELARVLKQAGVGRVDIWVMARAIRS